MKHHKAINFAEKLNRFDDHWAPRVVAELNDNQFKLVKVKGEFVWHSHEEEDELFHVIKGTLYMHFRDRIEVVKEGEMIVVPKGVEHNPKTKDGEEVHVLLFEKLTTAHTGNVQHEKTQTHYPKI